MGRIDLLPDNVKEAINDAEEATKNYNKRQLNLAIGYDGRLEIVDSVKKIIRDIEKGLITVDDVDEDLISKKPLYCRIGRPQFNYQNKRRRKIKRIPTLAIIIL